jgi:hypothetical protein
MKKVPLIACLAASGPVFSWDAHLARNIDDAGF